MTEILVKATRCVANHAMHSGVHEDRHHPVALGQATLDYGATAEWEP